MVEKKKTEGEAPPKAVDQVAELEAKVRELEDKYVRTYADFENYRKRAAREREEIVQFASERLLRELLEVKDHLELAIDHAEGATDVKPLQEGVDLTLKQLATFLEKFGVQEMTSLGEAFDPALHEAVHQEESQEAPPGTVVHEFQKGYLVNGRLLRPARVTVSKEKES